MPPYDTLQADKWGDRYFIAQLDAFGAFGKGFNELMRKGSAEIFRQLDDPKVHDELGQGLARLGDLAQRAAEQLRALAKTHPDHYAKAQDVLKQLQAELAESAGSTEEDEQELDGEESDEQTPELQLPCGHIKIDCGDVKRATKNQRALFDWLEANQTRVAQEVKAAIYSYYDSIYEEIRDGATPESVAPRIIKGDELDDTIRLTTVTLHRTKSKIGLLFDATWEDEHGLGVLIENLEVSETGYAEVAIFV